MSRLSPERVTLAKEIIRRYPVPRSAMVPLLHLAQEQDGYVTEDAMEHVAELIGCEPAEVYGTGSFYEMFKFHPVGRYVIGICTNISCQLLGGEELLHHAERTLRIKPGGTTDDGLFTLEDVECIAACTEAPCLQVNYRYVNIDGKGLQLLVDAQYDGNIQGGSVRLVQPANAVGWIGTWALGAKHTDIERRGDVKIISDVVQITPGMRSFYVADPDGVAVEFLEVVRKAESNPATKLIVKAHNIDMVPHGPHTTITLTK